MSIAEAVANASRYLTEHPEEASYRDSAATAHLVGGLRVEITGADGARLQTDMPTGIGGTATAPSPGWMFRAATASCVASLIAFRAAVLGIELSSLDVSVDSESDDRGILGLDNSIPAGPSSTRIEVGLSAAGRALEDLDALVRWAVDHCPVSDAIKRPVPIEVAVQGR
jgi:uncharacterized OsmC-like protein